MYFKHQQEKLLERFFIKKIYLTALWINKRLNKNLFQNFAYCGNISLHSKTYISNIVYKKFVIVHFFNIMNEKLSLALHLLHKFKFNKLDFFYWESWCSFLFIFSPTFSILLVSTLCLKVILWVNMKIVLNNFLGYHLSPLLHAGKTNSESNSVKTETRDAAKMTFILSKTDTCHFHSFLFL